MRGRNGDATTMIERLAPTVQRANLVLASEVKARRIDWLWNGRIAVGKLTMIAGDPGLGKSFLTLDIAARVSTGAGWPDSPLSSFPAGGVVILSAEDDPEDVIAPRLIAAKADRERIGILKSVNEVSGEGGGATVEKSFGLADLAPLEEAIDRVPNCRLVIIDPISAYCGEADSHSNTEVRGLLGPLSDLAAEKRVSVVCVSHLRKGDGNKGLKAIYRVMGSLAFIAASRQAYGVVRDQDDPNRRLLVPIKTNIGTEGNGLAYSMESTKVDDGDGDIDTAFLAWESEPINISADDAMDGSGRRPIDDAREWLASTLTDGPLAAAEIQKQAKADGISIATLKRAKTTLKVQSWKSAYGGPWMWSLAGDGRADSQEAHQGAHTPESETLR